MDLDRSDFTRAFDLAHFFHPDRESALRIATRAVDNLELAERVQARRRYYRPQGRSAPLRWLSPRRTKVTVERAQLLQRLVLVESEAMERREAEGDAGEPLTEDRFAISFVKHLVWNASRRNSLYVATALGKVVHSYSTAEVQELFSTVMQDADRAPEDSYVRAVKSKLFRDAKERYRGLLRTRSSAHGEEVFETVEPSPRLAELVRSCLQQLAPWDTECPLPEGFDASMQTLPSLRSSAADPDAEHPIEVRRIFTLVHPDCFRRLLAGLGLDSPDKRLAIPRLFAAAPPGARAAEGDQQAAAPPPPQTERDPAEFRSARASAPRPSAFGPISSVLVRADGRERARVDATPGSTARFELGDDATMLEFSVVADQDRVAAVYLLGPQPTPGAAEGTELVVDLGRGRELGVELSWQEEPSSATGRVLVEAVYRRRLAFEWLRQAWAALAPRWTPARRWATASVLALVALVGSIVLLTHRGSAPERSPGVTTGREATPRPLDETTRGTSRATAGTPLGEVRRIQVGEITGPSAGTVRSLIADELRAGGFVVATRAEDAEAQLRARLTAHTSPSPGASTATCSVDLELLDVRGAELWSGSASASDWPLAVRHALAPLLRRSAAKR